MRAVAGLALIAAVLAMGVPHSGATFTAASANPAASFAAAADFNTVTVTLADPGAPLHGTVALGATAASDRGIASVAFARAATGSGAWTTICTDTAAPFTCALDTTGAADGVYDLRAVATDAAGYSRTAVVAALRIDNTTPAVTLTDPGTPLAGTVTVTATATDAGAGLGAVALEQRAAGASSWTALCTRTTSPASCPLDTVTLPDGLYDLRARATDAAGNESSAVVAARRVDNTAPAVTLTDPGSPLAGSVGLAATAADAGSGVASVRFERAPAGTATWTAICTDTGAPFGCAFDTAGVADALYDLRAVATDAAGNTRTSTTAASRRVDNNGPTLALADPGTPLRGAVAVSATATDPAGVQSVAFEVKASADTTWTTMCTDTTGPYACVLDTTIGPDGNYDVRAVATDTLGRTSTQVIAARRVDNTAPSAFDVQGRNGGAATARRMDSGDALTFTWSEAIAPASLLAGWNGESTAVTVRVANSGSSDTLEVWNAANTARVNLTSSSQALALRQDWVSNATVFAATMVQAGAAVTVTLGTRTSGTVRTNVSGTTAMTWTPSTAAADLAGNPARAVAVTESGTADVDF